MPLGIFRIFRRFQFVGIDRLFPSPYRGAYRCRSIDVGRHSRESVRSPSCFGELAYCIGIRRDSIAGAAAACSGSPRHIGVRCGTRRPGVRDLPELRKSRHISTHECMEDFTPRGASVKPPVALATGPQEMQCMFSGMGREMKPPHRRTGLLAQLSQFAPRYLLQQLAPVTSVIGYR